MEYPGYTYPIRSLFTGSSLGNYLTFARLTAESDLEGLWSASDSQYYLGRWTMAFSCAGRSVQPQETRFSPESQTTVLRDGDLSIEKQFFIPFSRDERSIAPPSILRTAVYLLRLRNAGSVPLTVKARHALTFPACPTPLFTKQPTPEQTDHRVMMAVSDGECVVRTDGRPHEVRRFQSPAPWSRVSHDDATLSLEYAHEVPARGEVVLPFVLTYFPDDGDDGSAGTTGAGAVALLEESIRQYKTVLSRSHVATPNAVINRGLQWAKVNTVRVQHRYTSGFGFTNDPPQDIVVVRDVAWYMLGSDYVTPEFSRHLLDLCERHAFHPGGKLTEYMHAREAVPELHDYDLNINDNTPLFVHAAYHHALTTGNEATLRRDYPFMKRACDWILSQIHGGLVTCFAEGSNVWGICGWRNIIDGYNLTGAVTEINAECFHALHCAAEAARRLGCPEDAARFEEASESLRRAINERLLSENTGLYLLSHANDGTRRHDVTGDLIFTVMFGVALPDVAGRILERLTDEDMWTPHGSRTVSASEVDYHPDRGYQLVGGLWPNLTAWTAYCLRNDRPGKLVEGMVNIYAYCEPPRPVDFANVVPGQFPERIHGEDFTSRGMAMSPWMPPTYLWLGIEGLLGISPQEDCLEINPAIPPEWNWIGVSGLPYKGRTVSAFLFDGTLYADAPVESRFPTKIGRLLDATSSNDAIFAIAILVDETIFLLVAADTAARGRILVRQGRAEAEREVALQAGAAQLLMLPALETAAPAVAGGAS